MSTYVCRSDEYVPTAPDGRELVMHGSTAFPAACFEVSSGIVQIMPHWHDEFEVLFVCSGTATVCLGADHFTIEEGRAFFINAGTLHSMPYAKPVCRFRSIVFSPRLVGGGLESVFWEKYIGPVTLDEHLRGLVLDQQTARLVAEAWDACDAELPGYEFTVRSALSALLMQIALRTLSAPPARPSRAQERSEERVKRMMEYVHANYAKPLSLADLCRETALSQSECLRCFRSTIGTTPMQYVKEYRLTKAAGLLAGTDFPACDIASACGFSDAAYFSKAFRAWSGVSPSDYRRARR